MQTVGYIDREKYSCITKDITTDEVILTPERVQHIEDHHPGHFEIVKPYLKTALDAPDYILQDKNPNTGLILKEIETEEMRMQVVLRVHTSADEPGFKNSIISAWKIRDREYRRLLRNKKILYKRELLCYNKSTIARGTLEVVDFVQTTRRWYDRGKLREMQEELDACQVFSLLLLYPHNFIDESIL